MDIPQHNRQDNDHHTNARIRATARDVPRRIALRVHVAGVDGSRVGNAVRDGDGAGALDERAREGVGEPADDDLVGGDGAHGHEEHGEVAGADDGRAGDDGVAGDGEEDEDDDVDAAVAGFAGRPGYGDGDEEGGEPDCGRMLVSGLGWWMRGWECLPGTVRRRVSMEP